MDNGTMAQDEAQRQRVESAFRSAWSACVELERLMVDLYGMPPEKRRALSREERQQVARGMFNSVDIGGDGME